MKQNLLLPLLLLTAWAARAQTPLQQQSFEGTGADAAAANAYTATTVAAGNANIYFLRTTVPAPGYSPGSTVTNVNGSYVWASENVRRNPALFPNDLRGNPPANVTLASINVAGKSSLSVTVALADAIGLPGGNGVRWETDDYVRIQYRFNGVGGWNTIGQFVGDGSNGGGPPPSGALRQDYFPCDGIANPGAPVLNQNLTDYNFPIPGSGNTLEVRVEIDQDGASEEFGFDNIRVYGSSAVGSPPVLGSIESTPVAFAEGGSPVALTSTLTVSDPDSPGLASGSVSISANYNAAEDRLSFAGDASTGNITAGAFNTGTGVLPLTSAGATATPTQWQNAFRRVLYQNIDFVDATARTRTVSFSVTDPNNNISGAVQRAIAVTSALDAASSLPYTEPFETDGEGTRYASNHYFSQDGAQFQRTNANPTTTGPGGTTFSNIAAGTYYWVGVNTAAPSLNPTGLNNGTLTTKRVNATGYTNVHFQLRIGASAAINNGNQANWLTSDYFQLSYRLNGSSTWTAFGLFRGTGTGTSGGVIRQDLNPIGTGAPTGTQLTPGLQNFDFALPALNGQIADFRLVLVNADGVNYLAFDQLQVTGTAVTTVNSIVRASPNPTNAASVNYTVTFGGPVTGLTAANFSLTTSGISGASVGTPVSTGPGSTWTVPVSTGTGSGTLALNLANDTNLSADVTTTLPFAGETYPIDKLAPTVSGVSVPANGTYRTSQALSFTVNFSEAVTVTGTPQLGLTLDTGGSVLANYVSGSGTSALVFSYPIVAGNADGNGPAVGALALNGGTIRDAATNNASLTLNNVAVTTGVLVDGVAPAVSSINRQTPAAATTNATLLTYRIAFSEAVTGVTANDFTLTKTGTANGSVSAVTAVSSSVYDVTVSSASGAGTLRLDLNSSGTNITDVPGNAIGGGYTSGQTYTLDQTAPTVTALATTAGASGTTTTTTPFNFTVTFSEAVTGFSAGGIAVTNGSVTSGPTANGGNSYTFTLTPATAGTATTVSIAANAAQDAAGNASTASSTYALTYNLPTATVTGIGKLAPTAAQSAGGTATAQVSFTVTFSAPVAGVSAGNFALNSTISGAGIASVSPASGASATYTVVVNTGTGNGTLQLNVANATGLTPSVTNTPFSGNSAAYTVVKNFAAAPLLSLRGAGSATRLSDVTAFVDGVQVVQNGTSTAVANGLQNGSFETNNLTAAGADYLYPFSSPAVSATPWTFTSNAGVARIGGGGFTPAPSGQGSFVGLLQSGGANNGRIEQNLAVPTGTYQVGFVTAQRGNQAQGLEDQMVSVFLNDGITSVFLGAIQPTSASTYDAFTSAAFSVTAPALTATVSTTASSPTSTAPVPFAVSFSQPVGTSFTASDVTVTGGTLNPASFSGSGAGPYTFTVTPSGAGTVAVNLAAGVASDANNTLSAASNSVAVLYQLSSDLSSVSPAAELPGQVVTLTGTGFTSASTVSFGGTAASAAYVSATRLTVTVPAGLAGGSAPISVSTGGMTTPRLPFTVLAVYDGGTLNTCAAAVPATGSVGDGAWHYLLSSAGQVVAAYKYTGASLGTLALDVLRADPNQPVRQDAGSRYYLGRNWHLTASAGRFDGRTVALRLYGLNSEQARLQVANPTATLANLKATQYSGPNEDCQLANNDASGERRTLPAPAASPAGTAYFVAELAVPDHFSEFYLTGSPTPLPVELTTFTATATVPAAVRLAWTTSLEKNSDRFEIERSRDGRRFERIGQVAAAGSSTGRRSYDFLDANYPGETNLLYYRLRQVDLDGTAAYSPVRTVRVSGPAPLALFPNPTAHGGAATLTGATPGTVVRVFDALGREVLAVTADAEGMAALALPAGQATGVYVVRVGSKALRLAAE